MKYSIIILCVITFLNLSHAFSQPVWEQTNGPCSGKLTSITKDPQGYLYAITSSYSLYRSKDNGENWEKISTDATAITFDASNNCYIGNSTGGISLYDRDIKFVKILRNPGYAELHVELILIDANSNLYAKIFWGELYFSSDKGTSWSQVYKDGFDKISLDSTNVIIMTFDGGTIARSTNNGTDWNYVTINDATFKHGFFYSAYNKKFNIFIAVGMGYVAYISNDGGLTWTPSKDFIPIEYVEALIVDSKGDYYIAGDNLVCNSTDGGNTWKKLDSFPICRVSYFIDKDNYIFCTTWSNGVIRYDCSNHTSMQKNNGIINSSINQLSTNSKGYVFAATKSGIYRTTNSGDYWEHLVLPVGTEEVAVSIFCSKSGNIYASNEYALLNSTNDGQSWIVSNPIDSINEGNLTFAESDNGRIYAGNEKLYYSDDNGNTWQFKVLEGSQIVSIATFQNKYVLVGTFMDGVYFSDDECVSFRKLPLKVGENYGTTVSFNQNGDLFICMIVWQGYGTIFKSLDSGITFTQIPTIGYGTSFIRIDKNNYIYIGSLKSGKLDYSKDNGATWINIEIDSTLSIFINDICFGNNSDAYVGSEYDGVFKTSQLTEVGSNILIKQNDLEISPNPASDNISISFTNSEFFNGNISISNSLGIEIKRFNEKELSGTSSISFSTEGLPSGVYYCTFSAGTNKITKSFVVVK